VPWPGIAAFTHSSHVAVCMSSTLFSNIPTLAPLIVPNSILYICYPSTIIWQYWKCQQVSNFYGQPSFIDPSGGMEVVVWTVVWTAKPNRALGGIGMRGSLPPPASYRCLWRNRQRGFKPHTRRIACSQFAGDNLSSFSG